MNPLVITPTFTPRDSVAFKIYLSEIERLPLISPNQEIELCIRIANGDEHAVSELVQANLRFAISVAKKYQGLGLPLSDLVAEANIGLIKAARLLMTASKLLPRFSPQSKSRTLKNLFRKHALIDP